MDQRVKVILEQNRMWIDERGVKRTPIEPLKFSFGNEKDEELKKLTYTGAMRVFGIRFVRNRFPLALEGRYWTYFPEIFSPYIAFLIRGLVQSNRLFLYINPIPIPLSLRPNKTVARWASREPELILRFRERFCVQVNWPKKGNGVIFDCPLDELERLIAHYWGESSAFEGYIVKEENLFKVKQLLTKIRDRSEFAKLIKEGKMLRRLIQLSSCIFTKDYCDTGVTVVSNKFDLKTMREILQLREINRRLKSHLLSEIQQATDNANMTTQTEGAK